MQGAQAPPLESGVDGTTQVRVMRRVSAERQFDDQAQVR